MKSRTINEAINEVFKREGKPLRVKDVFLRIKEDNLYEFNTNTPEQVVRTALRRHSESLSFPSSSPIKLYTTLSDGTYWIKDRALPKSIPGNKVLISNNASFNELKEQHNKYLLNFKGQLLDQLKSLNSTAFEHFCRHLLIAYGFINVVVTRSTRDGGIDGYGDLKVGLSYLKVAFECKKWDKATVGKPNLSQFRGNMLANYHQGVFFTTSKFSKEAKGIAFERGVIPVTLIDGEEIVNIMIEKKVGVEMEELPIYKEAIDLLIDDSE